MEGERKVFSPEEKLRIALEGLSGTIQVSELCRKYRMSPVTFYYWKNELLNSSKEIFKGRGRKQQVDRRIRGKGRRDSQAQGHHHRNNHGEPTTQKKTGSRGVRIRDSCSTIY